MNSREKLLSILVGVSVLFAVAFMAFNSITQMYSTRSATILNLEQKVNDSETSIMRGKRAQKKFDALRSESLPSDLDEARTLYKSWISKVCEEVGIEEYYSVPVSDRGSKNAPFQKIKFQLDCDATLKQTNDLLYRVYDVGELHLVKRMSIKPIQNSKLFDLSITFEALALKDVASRTDFGTKKSDRLAGKQLEEYHSTIVTRNLFAPANQSPKLADIRDKTVEIGDSLSVTAEASDPDKFDAIVYSLEGDVPEGMSIDPSSGKISFRPKEEGTFQVSIRASDDGYPKLSDLISFNVRSKERPKPPPRREEPKPTPRPRFDESKFAYTMATYESNGEPWLWILVRTSGQRIKVKVGDDIEVGTFKGKVTKIDLGSYEFELDEGKKVQVKLGDSLAMNKPIDDTPIREAKLP